MSLRLVTPAGDDPVTLDEAKAFLRVTDSESDDLITALISAATISAQSAVQRLYVTQTVEWVTTCWHSVMRLPIAPVKPSGLVSIKYVDQLEQQLTLDPSQYVAWQDGATVSIRPKLGTIWPILSISPAPEPIVIRFVAGDDPREVPENVKTAIKFSLQQIYSASARNMFLTMERVEGVAEVRYAVSDAASKVIDNVMASLLADQRWD